MRKLQLSIQRGETCTSLLRKSIKAEHPRERERLLALGLVAAGLAATDAARLLGRNRITVEEWVHKFNEHGLEGIKPNFPGRPGTTILNEEELEQLKQKVNKPPRQVGLKRGTWSARQVVTFIKRYFHKIVSNATALRYLHRLGFGRKRPRRHYTKADPKVQKAFAQELQELEQHRCPRSVTVHMDEGQIWHDALPRLGWFLIGQPAEVDSSSPPKTDKLLFYVAIVRPLGKVISMICPWFNQSNTAKFLKKIRSKLKGYRIDLLYDGAPYHKGAEVRQAIEQNRIHEHRLPAYSPKMNGAEPWIGWVKEVLSANYCWDDHGKLVHSFTGFVASMAKRPSEVLRRCTPDMLGFSCR